MDAFTPSLGIVVAYSRIEVHMQTGTGPSIGESRHSNKHLIVRQWATMVIFKSKCLRYEFDRANFTPEV